ncbi:cytochrome bd-I oxidase subunit CydX [Hansschlegelia sp.]|nr:cytochrome bd-I oxidase subunit CydX [Hansschlegelia sp.]HVI29378.1 cytochrome bd-I oxidase subunit CydX [Hansschlegelia sp.]
MWYFAWVLGLGLAASFSVLNAMWLELRERPETDVRSAFAHQNALRN